MGNGCVRSEPPSKAPAGKRCAPVAATVAGPNMPTVMSSGTSSGISSSARIGSPRPIFSWTRFIHAGAHQQSSPSSFITAGTRNMRMTVASMISAAIMPNAMYFIITSSENPKAPVTTMRIRRPR